MKKRKVGLIGASANPLHFGHLAMAESALAEIGLDEVWFVITPHNPFKNPDSYESVVHRLHLAHLTARTHNQFGLRIKVSESEVLMRKYGVKNATIHFLEHFVEVALLRS